MPHLSPMSWLTMILTMLLLINLMNSIMWWKSKTKFHSSSTMKHTTLKNWMWL